VPSHAEQATESADDGLLSSRLERRPDALLIHRDNTFGTPEEDAFRRDFTVNALFYDIGTRSIIDYVGGLNDLDARLIRCIGDPDDRFPEDPVRMVRAIALAARLDFTIDPPVLEAIKRQRSEIGRTAPARLLEECYKILRAGHAERTFRELAEVGLLEHISPELHEVSKEALWAALARLDAYRQSYASIPETLTNAILLGSLIVPLGFGAERPSRNSDAAPSPLALGQMILSRRDVEHLRQILSLQRRLVDIGASTRSQRTLMHRSAFREALTWLEIHGNSEAVVQHWRNQASLPQPAAAQPAWKNGAPDRRRRRRRRRAASGWNR
jgi:poly(A) polymerase